MPEAGHMSPLRLQSTSCWHRASVYDVLTALCLRFCSAPQGDLCVPSSSRKLLTFEKSQLVGVAHSLLLRSVASYRGSEYACVQAHRRARRRSVIEKKATCACLSVPVAASCRELHRSAGTQGRPVAGCGYLNTNNSCTVSSTYPVSFLGHDRVEMFAGDTHDLIFFLDVEGAHPTLTNR